MTAQTHTPKLSFLASVLEERITALETENHALKGNLKCTDEDLQAEIKRGKASALIIQNYREAIDPTWRVLDLADDALAEVAKNNARDLAGYAAEKAKLLRMLFWAGLLLGTAGVVLLGTVAYCVI